MQPECEVIQTPWKSGSDLLQLFVGIFSYTIHGPNHYNEKQWYQRAFKIIAVIWVTV